MELIMAFVASCVAAFEGAVKHCYCRFTKCSDTFLSSCNLVISWLPIIQECSFFLEPALNLTKLKTIASTYGPFSFFNYHFCIACDSFVVWE